MHLSVLREICATFKVLSHCFINEVIQHGMHNYELGRQESNLQTIFCNYCNTGYCSNTAFLLPYLALDLASFSANIGISN